MESSQQGISVVQTAPFHKSLHEKTSLEVENRLQSLGFITINGRPRFKINEDIPVQQDDLQDSSMAKTDDSASFMVLGKSSMYSIEASSLDSFVDIQQKVKSIDYNSMISSLNSNEINQKLTELLQENAKLKETLTQNNIAMKQQFNTLATWRESIMKVHQNHKEKFVETKKLINYLKQQNAELKLKLSRSYTDDDTKEYKMIDSTYVDNEQGNIETAISGTKFYEKIASLSSDLNSSTVIYEKLPFDMKKSQNITYPMNLVEKEKINRADACMDSTSNHSSTLNDFVLSNSLKGLITNNISCDKCNAKDENIKNLNEFITLLEYKVKHAVALIQFCIKNSTNSGRYLPSIQKFNKELIDIFASEIEEFPVLRVYLNDFVMQTLNEVTFSESDSLINNSEVCNPHNESLSKQQKSVNQNILSNKKKENTIKAENSDMLKNELRNYRCNIETSLDKTSNLSISENNKDSECSQTSIPEINLGNDASLNAERTLLAQEKASLEQEKELSAQRKSLEAEYKNIDDMKKILQQEKISLNEERMSLDQQSQLYEDHGKVLRTEKKFIELKCHQLAEEIRTLQEELRQKELGIKLLEKLVENCEVEKNLLGAQLKIYEEDFVQERKIKESLLEQKKKLDVDLQNQFAFNKQLQNEVTRLKTIVYSSGQRDDDDSPDLTPPEMSNLACPKCEQNFRHLQTLESHVETCLELI